jgi:ribosomal RNA-processing protein 36
VAQRKEREAVKGGKGVFFQKRSEKKKQELIRRYEELKATGRLEKVMAKRQKKNAAKDHRYVPSARRQAA